MILVDAHVHIYDCYDLEKFFDSAYSNFKSAAERLDKSNDFMGVLLLAETANENWFHHLSDYARGKRLPGSRNTGPWKFHRTNETDSLYATGSNDQGLFLIAGRQLVTAEGLELLALATTDSFKDSIPITDLIETLRLSGAIPVIPWGLGKWLGHRGAILKELIENAKDSNFFLGDSSNRPLFLPYPSQLKLAQAKDIRNLPGTDPLPFPSEQKTPGRYGVILIGKMDESTPSIHLKKLINKKSLQVKVYGNPIGLYEFIKNQALLQFSKFRGNKNSVKHSTLT